MIDLYYAPSPNGVKVELAILEMGLPYRKIEVDVSNGATHTPEYLAICPNGKIPAIVDHDPGDGGEPLPLWESGAILLYLAEKTGRFFAAERRERARIEQWLMWQMAGLGPMLGQAGHFLRYTAEPVPYGQARYLGETQRLYGVLDRHLAGRDTICKDYSIADMASWPWVYIHPIHMIDLADYPHVARWFARIGERPAVRQACAAVPQTPTVPTADQRKLIFPMAAVPQEG